MGNEQYDKLKVRRKSSICCIFSNGSINLEGRSRSGGRRGHRCTQSNSISGPCRGIPGEKPRLNEAITDGYKTPEFKPPRRHILIPARFLTMSVFLEGNHGARIVSARGDMNTIEMTSQPDILFERRGAAGHVILNRPHALNAVSHAMVSELAHRLARWETDPRLPESS